MSKPAGNDDKDIERLEISGLGLWENDGLFAISFLGSCFWRSCHGGGEFPIVVTGSLDNNFLDLKNSVVAKCDFVWGPYYVFESGSMCTFERICL